MPAIAPATFLYGSQAVSERSLDLRTDLAIGVHLSSRVRTDCATICEGVVKLS
jgi:hypothetical protein